MWEAISNDHRTDLVHVPRNLIAVRWLRTACELIFRNQGIPAVVVDAATVRLRR
jgi:hypothetical protein